MPKTTISPSVTPTTTDPHEYREQLERVAPFASRVQLDFMDGVFAPSRCIDVAQAWWPEHLAADIHLMYQKPRDYLETLVSLKPSLVILHAEADGDIRAMLEHLQQFGIKAGVALLQATQPKTIAETIAIADHALIFSGDLGHFGGKADLGLLRKVGELRAINPGLEIGWDGGAGSDNVRQLAEGGIDVINVGGAIQKAPDPAIAYATLVEKIS